MFKPAKTKEEGKRFRKNINTGIGFTLGLIIGSIDSYTTSYPIGTGLFSSYILGDRIKKNIKDEYLNPFLKSQIKGYVIGTSIPFIIRYKTEIYDLMYNTIDKIF